ncbi:hypothetical protein LXL04_024117 [Taraxacum kok-saghyz]
MAIALARVPTMAMSLRKKSKFRFWAKKIGSEARKKISISGKNNRNTNDSEGVTARHTGGSIGFDEHHVRPGRESDSIDVFLHTHLTAASKAKYFAGDADGLRFCNETAREAYLSYIYYFYMLIVLIFETFKIHFHDKYREDLTHDINNDPDLWCESQLQRKVEKLMVVSTG